MLSVGSFKLLLQEILSDHVLLNLIVATVKGYLELLEFQMVVVHQLSHIPQLLFMLSS